MTSNALLQIGLYLAVLLLLVKPLGSYMARVYEGERLLLGRLFGPLERFLYRAAGVTPGAEMTWKGYAVAMLLFNAAGIVGAAAFAAHAHKRDRAAKDGNDKPKRVND